MISKQVNDLDKENNIDLRVYGFLSRLEHKIGR